MDRTRANRAGAGFEGTAGRLAGAVMARLNRDMERLAVDELGPAAGDSVLAVGFGPGVGLAELAARRCDGHISIYGIDPSSVMVEQAARRNRGADMELVQAAAESIPYPDGAFSGVIAVNSAQLWDPLDAAVGEIARVLAPGGSLITVTHVWAITKRAPRTSGPPP